MPVRQLMEAELSSRLNAHVVETYEDTCHVAHCEISKPDYMLCNNVMRMAILGAQICTAVVVPTRDAVSFRVKGDADWPEVSCLDPGPVPPAIRPRGQVRQVVEWQEVKQHAGLLRFQEP